MMINGLETGLTTVAEIESPTVEADVNIVYAEHGLSQLFDQYAGIPGSDPTDISNEHELLDRLYDFAGDVAVRACTVGPVLTYLQTAHQAVCAGMAETIDAKLGSRSPRSIGQLIAIRTGWKLPDPYSVPNQLGGNFWREDGQFMEQYYQPAVLQYTANLDDVVVDPIHLAFYGSLHDFAYAPFSHVPYAITRG